MIATDAPRASVLDRLVTTIEYDIPESVYASILLYDATTNRLRHGAAPHLPAGYREAIDGVVASPEVCSCGTAAFCRERVVVSDIATDRLWRDFRDVALAHDLRACWSEPIVSAAGEVLGTFAVYRCPRRPADSRGAAARPSERRTCRLNDDPPSLFKAFHAPCLSRSHDNHADGAILIV